MKKVFFVFMLLLIGSTELLSQEQQTPDSYLKVLEFWRNEKFRLKAEDLLDKINNPDKYKQIDALTLPEMQKSGLESTVSISSVVESEVHAAVNPTNPNNIVASPINQNRNNPTSALSCPIYYSKDQGESWQKSSFVTKPKIDNLLIVGGGDPVLVFDGDGKLYLSWINVCLSTISLPENPTQLIPDSLWAVMHYAVSEDGGETFSFDNSMYLGKLVKSRYTGSGGITYMLDKQWMASDVTKSSPYYNNVYTSAMQMNMELSSQDYGINMIVFTKAADSSQFDQNGVNITRGQNFQLVQFGSLDVDLNGHVHFTFLGARSDRIGNLYHCVSKNGGVTFSVPQPIAQIRGTLAQLGNAESVVGMNQTRLYPCPYVAIDRSNGIGSNNLYLTWTANGVTSNASRGLDIYFAKSTNGGHTWSDPKIVNKHPEGEKIHAYYSSINVSSTGVLSISYYDRRHSTSASTHYYLAVSKDQGETFVEFPLTSEPMNFANIGSQNNNFGIGEYNAIVSDGKTIIPIWADGRTNDGNINIYMAKIDSDNLEQYLTSVPDIVSIFSDFFITKLYPNPANEKLNIEVTLNKMGELKYIIYDLSGDALISGILGDNIIGSHTFDIDVKSISAGQYYLSLSTKNGSVVKKFNVVR
ncbi:MAG: T9SS type A sorting domain-containing protein [Candidatus Kapabacteria bacterium]|nr:T9SS type A sorting domain-containing protein [Candidatus Kapabacteria bacterium]